MSFIKNNGEYKSIEDIFVKTNGSYETVQNGFVKVNGGYQLFHSVDDGEDPQDNLDYIEIVSSQTTGVSSMSNEIGNLWGKGNYKDLSGEATCGYNYRHYIHSSRDNSESRFYYSYVVKMPFFKPSFNVSTTWLNSKGIIITGSTASIASKSVSNVSDKSINSSTSVLKADCIDNLEMVLIDNNVGIYTKDKSLRFIYDHVKNKFKFHSSAPQLSRLWSSKKIGGLRVGYMAIGDESDTYYGFWRYSVDVNYTISFAHPESGKTKTISKLIKFRTYNNAVLST